MGMWRLSFTTSSSEPRCLRTLERLLSICAAIVFPAVAFAQSNDLNTHRETVAIVDGKEICRDELPATILGQLEEGRRQEYRFERKAVEELVRQRLLDAKAMRKGVTAEKLLEEEVDSKIANPTPGEVEAYYLAQKEHNFQPSDEARTALFQSLRQARIQAAREAFLDSLQQQSEVVVLLQPPKVEISYDPERLKGSRPAPVTIIEFSDFSCPFCRQAEPILDALLVKFQGKLNLAYRDFPLRKIHPRAELAAEASRCAEDQGTFWEYHDLLFANADRLTRDGLLDYARKLSLDEVRFISCLDTGQRKPQVEQDLQDGARAGVSVTPAFFINGVFIAGAESTSSFEAIIESELARRLSRPGGR
jgi:protein-disulfide isomerase